MITGIDHIGIHVRNFDATVANYEAILGRSPNWRAGMTGVSQAWFQFDNVALDIVAADGTSPAADRIRTDIETHGEGIWALGFAVPEMGAAVRLFERRGLDFAPTRTTISANAAGAERHWLITVMRRKSTNGLTEFLVEQRPDAARWPVSPTIGDGAVNGLDHIVINTPNPDRALVHFGARLGLDLRLDRSNEQWGARQLFFHCGGAVVEIGASLKTPVSDDPDRFGGLAWRVRDPEAARARIAAAGIDVSELRQGRKPGTAVCTVRSGTGGVPTLLLAGND